MQTTFIEHEPLPTASDRSCPMVFVVGPAFVVTLVWLCTLLRLAQ
jgi:hypothetical protein